MKVLYVAHGVKDYGGAAKSLYNLISSVKGEVEPVVLYREEGPFVDFLKDNGIEVVRRYFSELIEYKKGLSYYLHLPATYYDFMHWERRAAKEMAGKLKDKGIDLVHSNSSAFTFGHSLAKSMGLPHVWHIREFLDLDFNYKVLFGRGRLRRMINSADARICISTAVRDHWRFTSENTFPIGNAVAKKGDFVYSDRKEPYVLFCSSYLTVEKGSEMCIRVFAASGIWQDGIKLRMYGRCSAAHRADLEALISSLGVGGSVEIRDFCPDLKHQYEHALAYIMTSQCEALGRVTIEAIVNGCPVVAYAKGGTLDIIKHGETGYLFDTVEECALLLRKTVNSDNRDLIKRAQAFVADNFTEESYGAKIIGVYRKVLDAKNCR